MLRRRWKVRTPLGATILRRRGYYRIASHWSGAKPVNVPVLVVDGLTRQPIPGAEVQLIHPYDDERPAVNGRTGSDGLVVLRNLFSACGFDSVIGGSESVTFSPWLLRVDAPGYRPFCASLAPPVLGPSEKETDPCLDLSYPLGGPVKIVMRRCDEIHRKGS